MKFVFFLILNESLLVLNHRDNLVTCNSLLTVSLNSLRDIDLYVENINIVSKKCKWQMFSTVNNINVK